MPTDKPDTPRPEAGADTEQGRQGEPPDGHRAESGGTRTKAGGTYGDYVPNRGQPRKNDDRDAETPAMGAPSTGAGPSDRLAQEPAAPLHPQPAPDVPGRSPEDKTRSERTETATEARENKSFDTTHVHTGTTPRRV
jgi:hypothetical protein